MAKKMQKKVEKKEGRWWELSIGLYPGILLGIRTYEEPTFNTHVLYFPFVDIVLEISK